MEQTWRWFGPDDPSSSGISGRRARAASSPPCTTSPMAWCGASRRSRRARPRSRRTPRSGCAGAWSRACRCTRRSSSAKAISTPLFDNYRAVAAQPRRLRRARRSATISCRCSTGRAPSSRHRLPGGGTALRFNAHEFAAFDCFMLERAGRRGRSSRPRCWRGRGPGSKRASRGDRDRLLANIMAGLPGAFDRYDMPGLRKMLARYRGRDRGATCATTSRASCARSSRRRRRSASAWRSIPTIRRARCSACRASSRTRTTSPSSSARVDVARQRADALHAARSARARTTTSPAIARRFAPRIHFAHLRNVAQGAGRLLHGGRSSRRRHRHGGASCACCSRSRSAGATPAIARLAHPVPPRPRPRAARRRRQARPIPAIRPSAGCKGLAEIRGVMLATAQLQNLPL